MFPEQTTILPGHKQRSSGLVGREGEGSRRAESRRGSEAYYLGGKERDCRLAVATGGDDAIIEQYIRVMRVLLFICWHCFRGAGTITGGEGLPIWGMFVQDLDMPFMLEGSCYNEQFNAQCFMAGCRLLGGAKVGIGFAFEKSAR